MKFFIFSIKSLLLLLSSKKEKKRKTVPVYTHNKLLSWRYYFQYSNDIKKKKKRE